MRRSAGSIMRSRGPQMRYSFSTAPSGRPCAIAAFNFNSVRISSATAHSTSGSASPSPFRPSSMRTSRTGSPASIASDSLKTS